jgi:tol-pal system protein YbgF
MNTKYCSYIFTLILISQILNLSADENVDVKTDILFLKIQELEAEIAELRNNIESQNYLIEKLIQESSDSNVNSNISEDLNVSSDIRFAGIEDPESKDQVYSAAIEALENQNFDQALTLFRYFVESFSDEEKTPLSFFWLAEISFINDDLENSSDLFLELINSYPNHYRVPLAHKKLGDIYLKSNDVQNAKDKYNFVVREYPNNTASSLALQLLKNME